MSGWASSANITVIEGNTMNPTIPKNMPPGPAEAEGVDSVNLPKKRQRWRIYGQCNRCGTLLQGAQDANVVCDESRLGQPNAVTFLDGLSWYQRPVRPEIADLPECVLTGEYDVC
jgi:hypothetical protein